MSGPEFGGQVGGNHTMLEIMIPGNKVGLIIGKGGETIKQLQERTNVKMMMIQESNMPSSHDKPLRITGEAAKCEQAQQMVFDLLASKDEVSSRNGGGGGGGFGDYGGRGSQEIPVPPSCVGVVIGKNGETIKRIQSETGARVQFLPGLQDEGSPERMCSITGTHDQVAAASKMVQEYVSNAMSRGPMGGGGGRGGGGGFGGGNRGGYQEETRYNIPAEKCGLVIGKGGETIKEINRSSGAFVQLERQQGPDPNIRTAIVRGNPDQIRTAIEMICEKAGLPMPSGPPPGGPGGPHGQGPPQGAPTAYPGYNYPQQNFGPPNQGGSYGGNQGQSYGAPAQGWGNANPSYGGQWQGSPKDAAVNPQTGQPDYSNAWVEYYRQQGMHEQADAILANQRAGTAPGGTSYQQPAGQFQQPSYQAH